jgi:hypothetical protein
VRSPPSAKFNDWSPRFTCGDQHRVKAVHPRAAPSPRRVGVRIHVHTRTDLT